MHTDLFNAIYTRYFPRLWEFASRFVGKEAAEEVVQDVMLDFWKRGDETLEGQQLTAFLYSAVRRRSWDVLRHQSVVERAEDDALANEDAIAMGESIPTPDEHLSIQELHSAFDKALDTLPDRTRAILQLRLGEGMSYEEIAKVLGISITAAKVQVSRAKKVLAPFLEGFTGV